MRQARTASRAVFESILSPHNRIQMSYYIRDNYFVKRTGSFNLAPRRFFTRGDRLHAIPSAAP